MVNKEYNKVIDQLENHISELNKFINKMQLIHVYNKRSDICVLFPEYIFNNCNISYAIPLKYCR